MKLYTEEQVKKMIEKSRETGLTAEFLILTTHPIELPSDDEIEKQAEHEDAYSKKCAFTRAAKWMWRKTFGGNNEQQ